MLSFATPGPITATVQVAGARVRVTAQDRTDTAVLVEPVDPASRTDVKVAARTKVDFADGRLSVRTTVSGDRSGSVAITIHLPTGSGLVAYLAHSEVLAAGLLGECELHLASGRVQLDRVGALQANVSAGEVAIGHLAGRATVDGGRGHLHIGHAADRLDFSSAGGGVDIDQADGSVTARTGSGPVRIGRLTGGRADLTTGSGAIEVGLGEDTAAAVDVDSERGTVHNSVLPPDNDHDNGYDNGDGAGPRVAVHARTRQGDIVVRRVAGRSLQGSEVVPVG